MRSQKYGLKYICSQTVLVIDSDILITLLVLRVQDKVSQASEQLMLARALSTNKVHDLLIAKTPCKERKKASSKIVQKYSEIYSH
jgi:hypothetical protein